MCEDLRPAERGCKSYWLGLETLDKTFSMRLPRVDLALEDSVPGVDFDPLLSQILVVSMG